MLTSHNIATAFLEYAARRPQFHGKWMPVAYWARKLHRKLDTVISDKKIQKAMEDQGLVGDEIDGTELMIEFLSKTVRVQETDRKRLFVCTSTPNRPLAVVDSRELIAVCQKAWNEHGERDEAEDEQQDLSQHQDEDEDEDLSQDVPTNDEFSPQQQQRSISPDGVGSPAIKETDLLALFSKLINPKYLSAEDLFVENVTAADIRSQLHDFGNAISINNSC